MSATAVAPEQARALKHEGQARGRRRASSAHLAVVRDAVVAVPVGALFTVNDLREDLDAADVPAVSRGPLLGAVARQGFAGVAQYQATNGCVYELQAQSSGRSAKGARVSVYVRMDPSGKT